MIMSRSFKVVLNEFQVYSKLSILGLAIHYLSSVYMNYLPCNKRGIIFGCQKYKGRCYLVRITRTFHWRILSKFSKCFLSNVVNTRGVQIGPGATAFTRTPFGARFFERDRVNATIAPFVEE